MSDTGIPCTRSLLDGAARERILVTDGAMGTMIQAQSLEEEDFRGERFADVDRDFKGNNDMLVLTQPDTIKAIHYAFLEAGADIVTTNTFNANAVSQADFGLEDICYEMNVAAAQLADAMADEWTALTPTRPRFVAGALGPTNQTASISPDVANPAFRSIGFDDLVAAYSEAARGLIDGGADILLIETIFDTLNAKAAIYAVDRLFDEIGKTLPVMVSGTITDRSGRTLTGQTAEAFWTSVEHARPFSIGFNCALGAKDLRPHVAELSRIADTLVCVYPNAGLPNEMGGYDETPEQTAAELGAWARDGLINIVGGCCGTTPKHIEAIAKAVEGCTPRAAPLRETALRLSGLEPFEMRTA